MKLVILRNNHTDVFGGVEQKICSIVERCVEEGIEVAVITTTVSRSFINELSNHHVQIYDLETFNIFKIFALLRTVDPDIIQSHQLVDSIITRFYKILMCSSKLRLVQRVHTHLDGYIKNKIKKRILMLVDKLTFFSVNDCLCISNALKKELKYLRVSDQRKIQVIENGTKLPHERPCPKSCKSSYSTACIVGDISRRKNQIETLRLLKGQSHIQKVHLCGTVKDGLSHELEKVIKESKIEIIKHGFVNKEELHEIYAKSDYLLLLSKFEGVPTVLFEARFHGLIPIFSDAGASKDYIQDGVDGLILGQSSFDKLPEVIERLTAEECHMLSLNSYKAFKNDYYESAMTSSFLKLYHAA